jgi:hypothetical protein
MAGGLRLSYRQRLAMTMLPDDAITGVIDPDMHVEKHAATLFCTLGRWSLCR